MKVSIPFAPRILLVIAFASAGVAVIAAIWAYPNQSQTVIQRTGIADVTARLAADVSELGTAAAPLLSRLGVGDRRAPEDAPAEEPAPETPPAPRPAAAASLARSAAAPAPAPAPVEQPGPPMSHPSGFVAGYVPSEDELSPPAAAPATAPQDTASDTSDTGAGVAARPSKVPAWLYDERVYSSDDPGVVPPRPLQPLLPRDVPRGVDPNRLGIVEFVVDQAGDVEVVDLVRESGNIHESMLLAVIKAWRFEPAMKDGLPVKFRQRVRVTY